jgi:hypothetical protein
MDRSSWVKYLNWNEGDGKVVIRKNIEIGVKEMERSSLGNI